MRDALQQAFQAGQNLIGRDWHLADFHTGEKCGCQPIGYTDFQEWLETSPSLNFVTARIGVWSVVNKTGEFTHNDLSGLRDNEVVDQHPVSLKLRYYTFSGPSLNWVMVEAMQSVLKNTRHDRYVQVLIGRDLFNFLTDCGFPSVQNKYGYVFEFCPDQP